MGAAEALGGALHDRVEHAVRVLVQLVVPHPQNRPTLACKESIPPNVPLALGMLTAIQFNNQPRLPAREVGNIRSDWQLTGELRPQP